MRARIKIRYRVIWSAPVPAWDVIVDVASLQSYQLTRSYRVLLRSSYALSTMNAIFDLLPHRSLEFRDNIKASLSPHLYLFFSRLCQVGFFVATARFALFYGSLYTFMRLVTTNMIASFLKTSLCMPKVWKTISKLVLNAATKNIRRIGQSWKRNRTIIFVN